MNPALYQLLVKHYRSRRLGFIIVVAACVIVFFVALGWGISQLVDGPSTKRCPPRMRGYAACVDTYTNGVLYGFGFFTLAPAITAILTGIFGVWPLRDLDQAPLVRVFASRRDEVAWLYGKRTSVRRYGIEVNQIHEIVVGLTNRKRVNLALPKEKDVDEALRLMATEAPRAARGYSSETEYAFLRDPTSVLSKATAPSPTRASVKMAIAPDFPFTRIDTAVRYLGLAPAAGDVTREALPGEPSSASWTGRGAQATYTFDPATYLRLLEISGVEPDRLRTELSTVVGVPALGTPQILGMLAAPDPRYVMLAIRAAEATSTADERRAYADALRGLAGHADRGVAEAAQRLAKAWG